MIKNFCADPGHGGNDPGAVGNGVVEKDWTLNFVKLLRTKLETGYIAKMVFSRGNDKNVALGVRDDIARANSCAGFFSIHINSAADTTANGFESFRHPNAPANVKQIQSVIHSEVMSYLKNYGIKDRGMKTANFQVLRENTIAYMPAILFENLFLSNSNEAKLLKDAKFVDGLADAYTRGIVKAFNLVPKNELAEALSVLKSAGLISNPDYWTQNAVPGGKVNGEYMAKLIENIAIALYPKTFLVGSVTTIKTMGIINTPDYWIENAVPGGVVDGDYAATLIKNAAKKLGGR